MSQISTEQLIGELSDDLQDLLIREAYIRQKHAALQLELSEKREKEAGLQQTRPAFLMFRGKDAKEDFKTSGLKRQQEIAVLEKTLADCEIILAKCGKIIEGGMESFFERKLDAFRHARAAQKLIPEWEVAVGLYRACLKRLVMTLGIARNQMSSGYDRKSGSFSAGALDAFNSALSAAKALDTETLIPNRGAKQFRELLGVDPAPNAPIPSHLTLLPYVPDIAAAKRVTALKAASFDAARAGVIALLAECEKTDEDLPALLSEANAVRASQEAMYRSRIAAPLAEIRAMADGSTDAAKAGEVWTAMEARFVSLTG